MYYKLPRRRNMVYGMMTMSILFIFDFIPFTQIGFYCGDPNISYKFIGDTVSVGVLLGGTFLIPLVGIGIAEVVLSSREELILYDSKKKIRGAKLVWHWYCEFLLGLCILLFVTEAAKSLVSEPRPHFLDTCRPDKAVNCSSGYVASFTCTNTKLTRFRLKDSVRSFPSGHAAFGAYTAVFMIWFFQKRIKTSGLLIVPWMQSLCVFWGLLCSLTRITDHRHHWWDVLAGFITGVVLAILAVHNFCHGFNLRSTTPTVNGKSLTNGTRHEPGRRLLSSTSSYSSPPDDRELNDVQQIT